MAEAPFAEKKRVTTKNMHYQTNRQRNANKNEYLMKL